MPESTACKKNNILRPGADLVAVAVVGAYTLGVAWFSWKYYPIGQTRSVENDFFAFYVPNAGKIIEGNIFDLKAYLFNPPGYSFVLALVGLATQDFFTAGKVISVFSSGLALVCVYFLVKKTFNVFLAILVLLATAANQYFILSSYYVGTDMMFMALACLTLLVLVSGEYGRKKILAAGWLTGLAYLTRYNGIFLIPVCAAYFFYKTSAENFWDRLQPCAAYLLAFAATILPWHLFLFFRRGHFFFNENHINIAYDFFHKNINKDLFFDSMSGNYKSLGDVVALDPFGFFLGFLANIKNNIVEVSRVLVPEHLGFLVIAGVLFLSVNRARAGSDREVKGYLFFSFVCYFLLMGLIHFEARYFLYLIPLISALWIYGFYRILTLFPPKFLNKPVRFVILMGAVFYVAWGSVAFHFDYTKKFNWEILRLSDFMKYIASPSQTMMSRSANIAYFSGVGYRYLPLVRDVPDLVRRAQSSKADFVFSSVIESNMRPRSERLADSAPWPGLQKIAESRPSRRKAVVYRVLPEGTARGILEANRTNFGAEEFWREFLRKTASPVNRVSLEGVLNIHTPGQYTLAFSADKFSLTIDGKVVMDDKRSSTSFATGTLALEKGFHLIRMTFSTNPKHVVPLGLFWETPKGLREAIPRSAFIINRVLSPSEGGV